MKTKGHLRFVIQKHLREGEAAHWDLMLESGDILETYRVNKPPEEWGMEAIEAVKIFDHPMKFLTYEGSVNKGKGGVKIADKGTYRIMEATKNTRRIRLEGKVLKGEFTLMKTEGQDLN